MMILEISVYVFIIFMLVTLVMTLIMYHTYRPEPIPKEEVKILRALVWLSLSMLVWPITILYFVSKGIYILCKTLTTNQERNSDVY